jgi:ABC-type branched-subunit amino acid transport system substrate-binding protein
MVRSFINIALYFLIVFNFGCSGISTLANKGVKKSLYSEYFLSAIEQIKSNYQQGKSDVALATLREMKDSQLLPSERSLRRNLLGVILFSKKEYEQAIYHFELALTTSRLDDYLNAQIYLNLGSTYYKMSLFEKAFSAIDLVKYTFLKKRELKNYQNLRFKLAKEIGNKKEALFSLTRFLGDKKAVRDLISSPHFEFLKKTFFDLSRTERVRFLEDFVSEKLFCVGYLAYLQIERLFYQGDKNEAKDLMFWFKRKFRGNSELAGLVESFSNKMSNDSEIDPYSIGIVLPLSGPKGIFGKRALEGIDSGFRDFIRRKNGGKTPLKIFVEDSKASAVVGSESVKKLIQKHRVSVIIGGLFSDEAEKEYLEAKKKGIFFISLSQVYLPKEKKDHLLLEIPGSVESQVNKLFSEGILKRFGKRVAIVHPESGRGKAYLDEFWRKSKLKGVDVNGIASFQKGRSDYRDPIKNLLGLKFKRERQEELELLSEIHALDRSSSTRRIQTLKPQIDFDWVFVPALPREALQIVPAFNYYDAFKLNIIGGPSWRSQALAKETADIGQLYFIGEDVQPVAHDFSRSFMARYGRKPKLIEMRSYDAFKILESLLNSEFVDRNQLEAIIRQKGYLSGLTGNWSLREGVWFKEMIALKLKKGRVERIPSLDHKEIKTPSINR